MLCTDIEDDPQSSFMLNVHNFGADSWPTKQELMDNGDYSDMVQEVMYRVNGVMAEAKELSLDYVWWRVN